MLERDILDLIRYYQEKKIGVNKGLLKINAPDPYKIKVEFECMKNQTMIIENIVSGHLCDLLNFKKQLSRKSRQLFCPYPWNNKPKLRASLKQAIKSSEKKIDTSFIIKSNNDLVGHFFLWKAGGNSYSLKYDVQVPELGIAIADKYQRKGLGGLSINFLKIIAKHLKADAIELTTDLANESGWNVYKKNDFQYTGKINNPLGVDVTEYTDQNKKIQYRVERQMVYILNYRKKEKILNYLKNKRYEFSKKKEL